MEKIENKTTNNKTIKSKTKQKRLNKNKIKQTLDAQPLKTSKKLEKP